MKRTPLLPALLAAGLASCRVGPTAPKPPTPAARPHHLVAAGPADDAGDEETDEQAWAAVRAALGRDGALREKVFTVTVPRDDLELTVQENDVPVSAGVASQFHFYRCSCGRINVIGQFVVADYEANDVIDALRQGQVEVASVGPMLLHERPRVLLVRFQGENQRAGPLARTLREALKWTGKERMAPQKTNDE